MKKLRYFLPFLIICSFLLCSCEEEHNVKPQDAKQITGDVKTIIGG